MYTVIDLLDNLIIIEEKREHINKLKPYSK